MAQLRAFLSIIFAASWLAIVDPLGRVPLFYTTLPMEIEDAATAAPSAAAEKPAIAEGTVEADSLATSGDPWGISF